MKKADLGTKKSCKTCIHADLPAKSEVCLACWRYQRWKNWEPVEGDKRK